MRDLGAATVAASTTLVAVYAAGVIFLAQHIADRYSPLLFPRLVIKTARLWLPTQLAIVGAALWLALVRETPWTDRGDAIVIGVSLLVLIGGLYTTFRSAADRLGIISMAHRLDSEERAVVLRDMAWSATNRDDITADRAHRSSPGLLIEVPHPG